MRPKNHPQEELVCELPFVPDDELSPLYQVCEVELKYKTLTSETHFVKSAQDAVELFRPYFEDFIHLQEQFVVMYLNRANRVLGVYAHSKGGITGTVADVRLILCTALKLLATQIIISHSHPSGSLNQSKRDEVLTKNLQEASQLMDIKLLDHLILTPNSYKSFADEGLL